MIKKQKQWPVRAFILIVGLVCLVALERFFGLKGDTLADREKILNESLSAGRGWTISREKELDGFLISAASSQDGKACLAFFEPAGKGGYTLSASVSQDQGEVLVTGLQTGESWYDLIWFQGADTEYAEIRYTIAGEEQAPVRYDTSDMEILCIKNPEKEYTLQAVYFDADGNAYES